MSGSLLEAISLSLLQRLDPERAHDLGLVGLKSISLLMKTPVAAAHLAVHCCNLNFAHPLGLAAGFDKNGDYIDALGRLGFAHLELGTVTPRPQAGSPKPRMFRIPKQQALINRMGFNNKGVDHLVSQLKNSCYAGVRGVSIGKNADTAIENAHNDYVECFRKVYAHADYVAVNVSSPNTLRLRELQGHEGLERIIGALMLERLKLASQHAKQVPLLVKVGPDLDAEQVQALADHLQALKVDGVIATNTSTRLTLLDPQLPNPEKGGLSGAPIHASSLNVIRLLRAKLGPRFPIIGVGGITDASHALASLKAGANLLQVYTGFALRGRALINEIIDAL